MGMPQQPVFPQPVSFSMNSMVNTTNNNQKNISKFFFSFLYLILKQHSFWIRDL